MSSALSKLQLPTLHCWDLHVGLFVCLPLQAQFVQNNASDWEAAFMGLLDIGLPRFLKHAAGVVVRKDKGFSDMVSSLPCI